MENANQKPINPIPKKRPVIGFIHKIRFLNDVKFLPTAIAFYMLVLYILFTIPLLFKGLFIHTSGNSVTISKSYGYFSFFFNFCEGFSNWLGWYVWLIMYRITDWVFIDKLGLGKSLFYEYKGSFIGWDVPTIFNFFVCILFFLVIVAFFNWLVIWAIKKIKK